MPKAKLENPYFEIRRSPIAGRGAFALGPIRKGTRIIEYVGELITDDEADHRYDDAAMKTHHTFLFAVGKDVNIDGAVNGNESRLINHSCEPNCEALDEGGRIFIHATKSIAKGAELTYDYRYKRWGKPDEETDRRYACNCASPKCRGTLLLPARKRARSRRARRPLATR